MLESQHYSELRTARNFAITQSRLIAIVRFSEHVDLFRIGEALVSGGVTVLEITLTTPGALSAIIALRKYLPSEILVGAGTILDAGDVRLAADAGAEFIVTPTLQIDSIVAANAADLPIACGAYTPTEALAAHRAGADFVKIFPADSIGIGGIKAMLAPLPFLKVIPTGGVQLDNIREFLDIGCPAVAVGSGMLPKNLVDANKWDELAETAAQFVKAVSEHA